MTEKELGAILPSRFKQMLKPLKKTAIKGERYYIESWYTPKVVTVIFHKGLLAVCTPTEYQSIVLGRIWAIEETICFSVLLTDLIGSYKYPGLLDVITDERLDLYKTDEFFIIKQGRDTFRMAVL